MASLPDYDPQETQEWLDALESVLENEGAERAHFLLGQLIDKARNSGAGMPFQRDHAILQHHTGGRGTALHRQPGSGTPHPRLDALECDGAGVECQPRLVRAGRAHRQLCLRGYPLRRGFQSFLSRQDRHAWRRSGVFPGALVARHVCARLPRRAHQRRADVQIPPGSRGRRLVFLSASVADAGLLAVPHGVDGPRAR